MAVADGGASAAVYDFVSSGSYPNDTSAVDASLTKSTIETLGKLLSQARADVQTSIRELSALNAPDIDKWLTKAKQIRIDREASIAEATEIQALHANYTTTRAQEQDSAARLKLLENEVEFTEGLTEALSAVKVTRELVAAGADRLKDGDLAGAVQITRQAQEEVEGNKVQTLSGTNAVLLLDERIKEQKASIVRKASDAWHHLVYVDEASGTLHIGSEGSQGSLEVVSPVLDELQILESKVAGLSQVFQDTILTPRFDRSQGPSMAIQISKHGVSLQRLSSRDASVSRLLDEVTSVKRFFKSALPQKIDLELSKLVFPRIQDHMMLNVLPQIVPPGLDGLPSFQRDLEVVSKFVQGLHSLGWQDTSRLAVWVDNVPQIWLQSRSADSLNSLRQVLKRGLGNPRSVERVETQTIVEGDEFLAGDDDADKWDAGWDDDPAAEVPNSDSTEQTKTLPPPKLEADDEDASGWGWDEETEEAKPAEETVPATEDEDDGGAEAWDSWNDENQDVKESMTSASVVETGSQEVSSTPNGKTPTKKQTEKTMTLRESYHITALPEQVLEVIILVVEDADALSRPQEALKPVAPAAPSLFALPGTLLAMFRAAAPMAYGSSESGNMYLYNDCLYLAEQLRSFSEHHTARSQDRDSLVLQPDISALELFGKRAYSREMEAQRTILGDLLDGAQGFTNCTEELQASQCDMAVTSAIDRIRQVHAQWRQVLSPSALLQAVGSLLSTVVSKIIVDIEDLSDIGEAESQRLVSYCASVSLMEDIFLPTDSGDGGDQSDRVPSTAVYVPTWLKFQYLANILESNLVDIKYLWSEGGLALEFSSDEVVDLIEALFADSPRRKEAINEIRRR